MEKEERKNKWATIIILVTVALLSSCVTFNIIKGDNNSINQSSTMEQRNDSVQIDNNIN